ncbi:GGDEF domain-containing protein, partial [Methylobacterium sp. WL122]
GDAVLRRVAERLRKAGYERYFPARLGGDEFAVVVPQNLARTDLDRMVRRLLHDLEIVVDGQGHIARVTGTVGIAWSSEASHDRDAVLRHADAALYAAKRTRKGTAQTYRVKPDSRQVA